MSAAMLKELDERVARGDSDDLILQSFVQEYGTAVIAEPPTKGFNGIAWFLPSIALAFGLGIVIVVILRWTRHPVARPAGSGVSAEQLAEARARADRETEE
jgi:cytochrome c-type biogenesis protein CcmH/NrfF